MRSPWFESLLKFLASVPPPQFTCSPSELTSACCNTYMRIGTEDYLLFVGVRHCVIPPLLDNPSVATPLLTC